MPSKQHVHILLSQKAKTPFVKAGIDHYVKKLQSYTSVHLIEARSENSFREQCKKLEKKTVMIVLSETGRQHSSKSFAKTWENLTNQRARDICFIVGGPHGFTLPPRTDLEVSLSSMTYNHELVPLVLLEQLYRAFSIIKGHPYHHA